jgi:hypothetical protein
MGFPEVEFFLNDRLLVAFPGSGSERPGLFGPVQGWLALDEDTHAGAGRFRPRGLGA